MWIPEDISFRTHPRRWEKHQKDEEKEHGGNEDKKKIREEKWVSMKEFAVLYVHCISTVLYDFDSLIYCYVFAFFLCVYICNAEINVEWCDVYWTLNAPRKPTDRFTDSIIRPLVRFLAQENNRRCNSLFLSAYLLALLFNTSASMSRFCLYSVRCYETVIVF
jgi:hypothetical protein